MFIIYLYYKLIYFFSNHTLFFILIFKEINFFQFLLEINIIFFCLKLFYTNNPFRRLILLGVLLLLFSGILFWYQIEVYACFLLVNELMILLFIFILLIYKSYPSNIKGSEFYSSGFLIFLNIISFFSWYISNYFVFIQNWMDWYWIDFYSILINLTYNDLVAPFYFFYIFYPNILLFLGLFLFFLSVIYLYLIFQAHNTSLKLSIRINTNTQEQNLYKPSSRHFKSNFNDL